MDETQEIIKEQFKKLPRNVQGAILSANLQEKLKRLTEKYHLRVDQAGSLETETLLVMLGLERPDSFSTNIEKEVRVSTEVAQQIANDVNAEIFLPIRESLKQLQPKEEELEQAQERKEQPVDQEVQKETPSPAPAQGQQPTSNIPPNLPTGDISSLKLGGALKIPREEQSASQDTRPVPKADERRYETDPYREPIE